MASAAARHGTYSRCWSKTTENDLAKSALAEKIALAENVNVLGAVSRVCSLWDRNRILHDLKVL